VAAYYQTVYILSRIEPGGPPADVLSTYSETKRQIYIRTAVWSKGVARLSFRLIVTNGQPKLTLPYKDVLSMRIVPAKRIKYQVGRCIMKKYREEKGLRIQGSLSITIVEASRFVGNADLNCGPVRTSCVFVYLTAAGPIPIYTINWATAKG
jgi:hypothetical protein